MHVVVQELGREIGAVGPDERTALGVDVESAEDFDVAEGLKDFAVEFRTEVYLAGGAVAEAEPHGVATPVASLEEFRRTHDGNVGSATRRRQGVGYPERCEIELAYVRRWTLLSDVSALARRVGAMVVSPGG